MHNPIELIIPSHLSNASSKGALTTVLQELCENLSVAQWKHLSSIESLLKPFVHQTNVANSENSTGVEGT